MELSIFDSNLLHIAIVDVFDSCIWTDRYCGYGDFEIYTAMKSNMRNLLQADRYLTYKDSDHVMIIEDHQVASDIENGDHLIVTGRSLESILERRIIWGQTVLTGNLQNGIQKLLNENAISPTVVARAIPNLVFEASTDPIITALTIDAQFTGDNLYDTIKKLCSVNDIGFKITLTDTGLLVFKLYAGIDRSYAQVLNPYVVFSRKNENIINTNSLESKKGLKTVALVAGEGEGATRKTETVEINPGGYSGLSRRETFTDARDISSTISGRTLTAAEYTAQLKQRGVEDLASKIIIKSFEGKADTLHMYKYGEDFFMGDIVQLTDDYGSEFTERVTEMVISQSTSGTSANPTFSIV